MVMLGQRWEGALKPGLNIDLNTNMHVQHRQYANPKTCMSKHKLRADKQNDCTHTAKNKDLCGHTQHLWVCSHYSRLCQRCSCPAGLSPDPQHWSQAGRTVFYISQGALQAHNTPLTLWSRSQVLVHISLFLARYEWEERLWWTEPEQNWALVWYWLCKVGPRRTHGQAH